MKRWTVAALILVLALPAFGGKGDDAQIEALEAKVETLEAKIDALGSKLDAHFAGLDAKLAELAAGPEAREGKARAMLTEVNQAIGKGEFDQARTLLANMEKQYGTTQAFRQARSLKQELEVFGKDSPADLSVEKWFQGEAAIDDGQATLIVFWEVWCPHCKREVPKLEKIYNDYKDQGLNVVGLTKLTRDTKEEVAADFIKTQNVTYPMGKETGGASSYFNVSGIPAAAVVKDGKIVWRGHPARLTEEMLKGWL